MDGNCVFMRLAFFMIGNCVGLAPLWMATVCLCDWLLCE